MPLIAIDEAAAGQGNDDEEQLREYCAQLEAGAILFFPQSPIRIAAEDLAFLLNQQQAGAGYHKNIAYRRSEDRVTGFVKSAHGSEEQLRKIMREYSQAVVEFLGRFLAPYQQRWQLDYASYRPQPEESRQLALRKRNDLMHTDAFPTRPTNGNRILRFFNNINPVESRNWVTGGAFGGLVRRFAVKEPAPAGKIALPSGVSSWSGLRRFRQAIGRFAPVHAIAPQWARSPYDAFMMDFHNFLKENADYQENSQKEYSNFPPGASWMCYTDTISHAVLSGRFALEQTLLVRGEAMVNPEISPLRILESMVGGRLV
ncbi:MAG: Kdo hydroxylase family protein [Acidobacteriaceae bacterium]